MIKNRIGYVLVLILLFIGLVISGQSFLLGTLAVAAFVPFLSWLLLRRDATNISVSLGVESGGREGQDMPAHLSVHTKKPLCSIRNLKVDLEIENRMFGIVDLVSVWMELPDRKNRFDQSYFVAQCGEARIHCTKITGYDMMHLWQTEITPCPDVFTTIYPSRRKIRVEMAGKSVGLSQDDGIMQNKKGQDVSEMFDLKEYVPGDDVRSIHWKLSEKTGHMMIRQGSRPMQFQMVIMPDLGYQVGQKEKTPVDEINAAVTIGNAIGEKLLALGIGFYLAIPTDAGLELLAVDSHFAWNSAVVRWLGVRMQPQAGRAIELFRQENLEQLFTKLILLSAGEYRENLGGIDNSMDVLIINSVRDKEYQYARINQNCEMIDLPVTFFEDADYRIFC